MLWDFRLYTCKHVVFFLEKNMHVSFSLSLELAGIEVQAGMFVSKILKSVCTSEQSDQTSHFLPKDCPSKNNQTAWMGTHVNLYLLLDTGFNNNYYNSWILTLTIQQVVYVKHLKELLIKDLLGFKNLIIIYRGSSLVSDLTVVQLII